MNHSNLDLIRQFFEAYGTKNLEALNKIVDPKVRWIMPGHHPLSGTRIGIDDVLALFDEMGNIMAQSNIRIERLVTGVEDHYVVECQHIITNRDDGNDLDHYWCVLWTFSDGKLIEGRHLSSDQHAADTFFCKVLI